MSASGQPQRILIYGMNYAPELAGVGRYSGDIGAYLAACGHEVTVVTTPPHYPGWKVHAGHSRFGWRREDVAGVTVHRCPLVMRVQMDKLWRAIAPFTFALSSAPVALVQALRRRPDVILAVEPTLFVAPVALMAAKLSGARPVLHVQDLEIDAAFAMRHLESGSWLARLAFGLERGWLRGFETVITISNRMSEKLTAKGVAETRLRMVRNWVDLDQIKPLKGASTYRGELGLENAVVALYAGNLGAKQGLSVVIEAARRLADRKDVVFVVAGEGPMRPQLEAAAAKLSNIRLLGLQPDARFSDFLGLADVHLLPQERDAADLLLPSKLGGMLASGRQVIVTADPGTELAEFLGASCVLTPPGDAEAMADAIAALADGKAKDAQRPERLARAAQLSKAVVIAQFRAALLGEAAGATRPKDLAA
jgi:colanic acid biosynthesis glycosyl transferase WcaI